MDDLIAFARNRKILTGSVIVLLLVSGYLFGAQLKKTFRTPPGAVSSACDKPCKDDLEATKVTPPIIF